MSVGNRILLYTSGILLSGFFLRHGHWRDFFSLAAAILIVGETFFWALRWRKSRAAPEKEAK
jgi:hypothetical protein